MARHAGSGPTAGTHRTISGRPRRTISTWPRQAITIWPRQAISTWPRQVISGRPRRRSARWAVAAVAVVSLGAAACTSGTASQAASSRRTATPAASHGGGFGASGTAGRATTVTVTEPSWQLANPLSRMVVLPDGSGALALLGGLTSADTSADGAFRLSLATGTLSTLGTLPSAVHDGAGAVIGGTDMVLGGGSTSTVPTVEGVPVGGGAGTVIGQLPQPRSDTSATTVGATTVVVGGYNGTNPDPTVLSTTDGTSFSTVTTLPVPVRYAAVAALGSSVYVFGGMATEGTGVGLPVATVQRVDLTTRQASIVATLPEPIEGAAAVVLGGRIFVAGGDTASPGSTATTSSAAVLAFDPASARFTDAGTLAQAVAYAGSAVTGGAAWLVGGEHDGQVVAAVQELRPG